MSKYGIVVVALVVGAWLALGRGGAAMAGETRIQEPAPVAALAAGVDRVALPASAAIEAYPGPATTTPVLPTATPDSDGYPAPGPTRQPTRTPWPSPTPTPDRLTVSEVRPAEAADDAPVRLRVYGYAFGEGARVWLGVDGQPALGLTTTHLSSTQLAAVVPLGVTPGVYDVIVEGEGGESEWLTGAFLLFGAATWDDLRGAPFRLWSDPAAPHQGESVDLGLIVSRAGGSAGTGPFAVRFAVAPQGHPRTAAVVVGEGTVAGLDPDGHASTSAVAWAPHAAGYYTVWAEIDPQDVVAESPAPAEANNVISRTIIVRSARQDEAPPVVDGLTINGGQDPATTRSVAAEVVAHDPEGGSGLAQAYYVESHWVAAARSWVPVEWSGWLPYGQQPHTLELAPEPGLRYVQAWVADGAGNVSRRPASRLVTYAPAEAEDLEAGEVRAYRVEAAADLCLVATLISESGDADLYVWPPGYAGGAAYWYSRNPAGEPDRIAVTPTMAGAYQVEVEAYAAATYRLSVAVADTCPLEAGSGPRLAQASKTNDPRDTPSVPLSGDGSAPPEELAVPEPPAIVHTVHVPAILGAWQDAVGPSRIWQVLVPMLVRP